jgi:hypothetical protein
MPKKLIVIVKLVITVMLLLLGLGDALSTEDTVADKDAKAL